MTRPRILICSLGLCAVAATLAAGGSLLLPAVATATTCFCPAGWSTLNQWGAGSSCAAAIADFEVNAQIQAEANCSSLGREVCATEAPTHGDCYFAAGLWRVDGQMRYKCLKCFPPTP